VIAVSGVALNAGRRRSLLARPKKRGAYKPRVTSLPAVNASLSRRRYQNWTIGL
jgi:hypothetical protein